MSSTDHHHNNQTTEQQQNLRAQTTVSELTKTGTIDAVKTLVRQAFLQSSTTQHYDRNSQEKSLLRNHALEDEKVHYCIHLMKSFVLALGCERTWETFLLEMDLEDDQAEFDHKEHFHWLTHDVKPLQKQYDLLEGRLPPEKQTPEPYMMQDHSEGAPYGALYSFVSDSWQTKQELANSVAKEQGKQVEGAAPDQVRELLSFLKTNKENLGNLPAPSPAIQSTTPQSQQQQVQLQQLQQQQQQQSQPPPTTTVKKPTSRANSPARSVNTGSIVDPQGVGLSFPNVNMGGVGTSFNLPGGMVMTPQLRPSSGRPASPARSAFK